MSAEPRSHHRAVLVVDDDEDIRLVISDVLELSGYRAVTAGDGEDALMLMARDPEVGLVLLDMMMPGVDGWEFRRRQLQDPTLARVPVVILSGAGGTEKIAHELGADGFLSKPVMKAQLLEMVKRYC